MKSIVQEDIESVIDNQLPWEAFAGANVLVTGAAGFLPAYMVETLLFLNRSILSKPCRIVALVRNQERARARFREHAGRSDLEFVVQDVSDELRLSAPFDYIIHAASQASPVFYKTDPVGTLSANVLGTYHLLNAAKDHPCKGFLYFSSGDVYGNVDAALEPVSENQGGYLNPADVRSCYGESKRIAETMCVSWAHQFGVPTHIVRPSHTYGPGMRLDDGRVFADFVRDILNGGPIVLLSDGSARRCFCYLADATAGFFTVLLKGEIGQAYNVANPEGECSIAELADRLAKVYRDEGILVERRARIGSAYVPSPMVGKPPSVEKLKALGWRITTSIEEGFQRTVTSYRQNAYSR
jgi:nucleoside-diphosphate-sugar epimerase